MYIYAKYINTYYMYIYTKYINTYRAHECKYVRVCIYSECKNIQSTCAHAYKQGMHIWILSVFMYSVRMCILCMYLCTLFYTHTSYVHSYSVHVVQILYVFTYTVCFYVLCMYMYILYKCTCLVYSFCKYIQSMWLYNQAGARSVWVPVGGVSTGVSAGLKVPSRSGVMRWWTFWLTCRNGPGALLKTFSWS